MSQPPAQPPTPGWATPAPGVSSPQPEQPGGVWSSPVASQQPGPQPGQPGYPYAGTQPPTARHGSSLAVWLAGSALVVALVALAVALVALFLPIGTDALGSMTEPGGGDGTVPGAVAGQQLSGDRIGYAVVDALLQMGADVEPGGVECESLLRLDDGSSSDCHGTVDGDDTWSGTAEFYGDTGDFTLYED